MTSSKTTTIFHSIVLLHHTLVLYQLSQLDYESLPEGRTKEMMKLGGRYLTTWNMLFQTLYIFVAFCLDVQAKLGKINPQIRKFNGYFFNIIVFPSSLFVAMGFWTLFTIKPDWVLPDDLRKLSSDLMNHALHTNIVPVVLGELLLTSEAMPRPKFRTAMITLNCFIIIYTAQYMYTYYMTGIWMYGIFYELTWSLRALFMVLNSIIMVLLLKFVYFVQGYKTQKKGVTNIFFKFLKADLTA